MPSSAGSISERRGSLMYYYPMMYFDPTYIFLILGAVLSLIASAHVKSVFRKYSEVRSASGLTGTEAAESILRQNGIYNVTVHAVSGDLTDNYVPSKKVLNLSDSTRNSSSIAAIGVAAHECGHAIQDAVHYSPLLLSQKIAPACSVASQISWPLFLFGLIIGYTPLISIGIYVFIFAMLFQIITLPVEFNASYRAVQTLRSNGMLTEEELTGVKRVLTAAALTYVAAAATMLLQLLRLLILAGGRRRDD